jgi:hypothetical protein
MQAVEAKKARQIRLRTLLIVIAFLAMALALIVQTFTAAVREQRLRAELELSRARAEQARFSEITARLQAEVAAAQARDALESYTKTKAPAKTRSNR